MSHDTPTELTVHEDPVTGTWTFHLDGHTIQVEPRHGYVKIDGTIHEADILRGLHDAEQLAGEPLAYIHQLIAGRQDRPAREPQTTERATTPSEASPIRAEQQPERTAEQPADRREQPEEEPREALEEKSVLTTRQAARYVELSPKTLETMRTRGGGPPYVKIGRRVVYRRADLDAWLSDRVRHSTSGSPDP